MTAKKTIRIKPRRGIVLAGLPAAGGDVEAALAEEWIAGGLASRVDAPKTPKTAAPAAEKPQEAR